MPRMHDCVWRLRRDSGAAEHLATLRDRGDPNRSKRHVVVREACPALQSVAIAVCAAVVVL